MPATIRSIVDQAQLVIGEVAGVGVQQYGDDRLLQDVISGFNMLFTKYAWDQYTDWFHVQLDGTTGIMTTDALERVMNPEDIVSVCYPDSDKQIPKMPTMHNPRTITGTNTTPVYWSILPFTHEHYDGRKLRVYPATAIGFIDVLAKIYPLVPPAMQLTFEDVLHLDKDLLSYAAAFMTLVGDDLNPGAAETVKSFMDMRYNDITNALSDQPIPLRSRRGVPTGWWTKP